MSVSSSVSVRDTVLLAAWVGLCAGVLESLLAIGMQRAGYPVRVPVSVLWIAPVVNLLLYLTAGVAIAAVTALRPLLPYRRLVIVVVLWMLGFGLLQTLDRVSPVSGLVLALGIAMALFRARPAFSWWAGIVRRLRVPIAAVAAIIAVLGVGWPRWSEARSVSALPPAAAALPNVLLVTLDTLRADHVSAYGYPRRTTPNFDALAARGVLFEHAISNSSWTLPSHASLLTSRYPHQHGADWLDPMRPGIPTIAEVLARHGYRTGAFAANTSYVAPEWGIGGGFTRFDAYDSLLGDRLVRTAYGRRIALNVLPRLGYFDIPGRRRASRVNDAFLSWLDQSRTSAPGDTAGSTRPFFAFLNFFDVHDPYLTFEPYQSAYSSTAARGDVINFQFQAHAFRRKPMLTPAEVQAEVDAYDGCLTYLDAELGRLMQALAARGLGDNTVVVVASDHGEAFGNHNLFGHGNSLYYEAVHVPLLVVWPGHVPASQRVATPVGLHQVPATLVELLGIGTNGASPFQGRSLVQLWRGDATAGEDEAILSEVTGVTGAPAGYPTSSGSLASLLTPQWHLITSTDGSARLFAWRDDPSEQRDLSATPAGRAALESLMTTLQRMREPGAQ